MGRYASKRKSRNYRPVSLHKRIKKNRKPKTDDQKILEHWDIKKTLNEVGSLVAPAGLGW